MEHIYYFWIPYMSLYLVSPTSHDYRTICHSHKGLRERKILKYNDYNIGIIKVFLLAKACHKGGYEGELTCFV